MKTIIAKNIDEYIASHPKDIQTLLEAMRATIRKAAPQAEEAIKYALPTFVLNGNVVHFGAFRNHIGFYPTPGGIAEFRKELSIYGGAKGSIRFPIDEPLPLALVGRIVKFRVAQNLEKPKAKSGKKS